MDIYFDDLTEEAQQRVLEFYGYETARDGNFDVVPIFTLETEGSSHEQVSPSLEEE